MRYETGYNTNVYSESLELCVFYNVHIFSILQKIQQTIGNMNKEFFITILKKAIYASIAGILAIVLGGQTAWGQEIVVNPPGGDTDAVPLLTKALKQAREKGISTIRINPGIYHVYPDMAQECYIHVSNHDHGLRRTALPIWDMKNLTIEAEGAILLAHHQAFIPVTVYDSKNITIKGLAIDWAEPLHLQGQVESVDRATNSFVAVMQHPERIVVKNNKIYHGQFDKKLFCSKRLLSPWQLTPYKEWIQDTEWTHWIDSKDGSVLNSRRQPNIRDWDYGKNGRPSVVENLGNGRFRFTHTVPQLPEVGYVFVAKGMFSPNRTSPGVHLMNAEEVVFNQLTIHHAGGMGLIAQRCKNVTLDRMRVAPAEGSGRWVSTLAEATHFNLCQGKIVIKNSTFEYMLDDATNVHGVNVLVVAQSSSRSVVAELKHFQQYGLEFARPGERLRFSEQRNLEAYGERRVESVRYINEMRFEITFTEPIEGFLRPGTTMDNLDCQPDLFFIGNRVANNRARSLIFSTEGKVIIADNHFEHPVSEAIKVLGDANFWFESGQVRDVTIKNNVFISRSPECYVMEFGPEETGLLEKSNAPFHSNIKVINNEFYVASPKIIQAHRVDGLEFSVNTIRASKWYVPDSRGKSINIERCSNVSVSGNTVEVKGLKLEYNISVNNSK
jgi:hypothetical protein